MSHVIGVSLQVTNLDDLKAAATACGLEFREGQRTYNWYKNYMDDYHADDAAYKNLGIDPKDYGKCDHALSIPGHPSAYEVGVVARPDGTYSLLFDFYNGGYGLQAKIGDNANKLKNEYGVAAATRVAYDRGDLVQRVDEGPGRIRLTVTPMR